MSSKKGKRRVVAPASKPTASTSASSSRTARAPAAKRPTPSKRTSLPSYGFDRWIAKGSRDGLSVSESTGPIDPLTVVIGAVVTAIAFVLYAATTAHSQIAGDTPDFLITAKTLGVAHAPGYPLVTMLGHIFSWLPIGTIAFRIDLLATFCGAATVALVYATGIRLTRRPWVCGAAAIALAFTPLFWKWSLQAETFPLNNVLAALLIFLLISWHQNPQRTGLLVGSSLVFGLGVSNQQTMGLLAVGILVPLWLNREVLLRRPVVVAWCIVAVLAGFLPYIYVPLAAAGHPPENWDNVNSVSSLWNMVTRHDYSGQGSLSGLAAGSSNYLLKFVYLLRSFGFVMGIWALVGCVVAYFRVRWLALTLAICFVVTTLVTLGIIGGRPWVGAELFVMQRFFLLPLVVASPLVAVGLAGTIDWLSEKWVRREGLSLQRWILVGLVTLSLAVSTLVVVLNYSAIDVSHDNVTDNYARSALMGLRPNTILFVGGDQSDLPILYANKVEGVRPDVTVVISSILPAPWYQSELRQSGALIMPSDPTTLNIVQANSSRPIDFIDSPPDHSLQGQYYLYLDGLAFDLEPQATTISITQAVADNNAKLATYTIPNYKTIKRVSFESFILQEYALIPYTIGKDYLAVGHKSDALAWFRRGLTIDPHNEVILSAVRQLGATP